MKKYRENQAERNEDNNKDNPAREKKPIGANAPPELVRVPIGVVELPIFCAF